MWHLKTKVGLFWVAPVADLKDKYFLGINDQELGIYPDADQAAKDVHDQRTGYLSWDSQSRIKAPEHIFDWSEGEPKEWKKH